MTQDTEVLGEVFPAGVSIRTSRSLLEQQANRLPTSHSQTILSVPSYTIHHLDSVWGDAMAYRPERWLEEGGKDLEKNLNVFSYGPRSCVGRK